MVQESHIKPPINTYFNRNPTQLRSQRNKGAQALKTLNQLVQQGVPGSNSCSKKTATKRTLFKRGAWVKTKTRVAQP